jgi:nucleoside-diphosphate-sugar epimerase
MRILITGGTGFLGGRLVAHLASTHEVWVLTRRDPPATPTRVRWLRQDLAEDAWQVALPAEIDAIVHLAQSPNFRYFPDHAREIFAVAAGATMRLLDWGVRAGAKTFILASTGGLYGTSDVAVRETDPLPEVRHQLGFYFAAKRASELIAAQYAGQINTAVLRYFFVYGSGQAPQMLMPRLVANIRNQQPIYLHGEEGIRLNPVHVDDAVRSIERCLDLTEGRLFNIAGPQVTNLREIALVMGRCIGRDPIFTVDTTVPPNHLVADIQRMSGALGAPQIGIEAGIAELCGGGSR